MSSRPRSPGWCPMLLLVIYLPYWYPAVGQVSQAWAVAGTFVPISFGWVAGDVSLAAYIQALLARHESETSSVSALGAVTALLCSTYIFIYAISSPLLGRYVDSVYAATGEDIHGASRIVDGVQYDRDGGNNAGDVSSERIYALNPMDLYGERLENESADKGDTEGAGSENDRRL